MQKHKKKTQSEESIRVCIRVRPLLKPYEDEEAWIIDTKKNTISSANIRTDTVALSQSIQSSDPLANLNAMIKENKRRYYENSNSQVFAFDHVEASDSRTQNIYNKLGRPIVKSVLDGYNGTIFMYGQTTSGKTYTMLGSPESPGVLPCAMRDIFTEISKRKDECSFKVWVSYMEIYNESINDLLTPNATNLKIQEDPQFGIIVNGLKQQQVWSFDQSIILMNYGEEHRKYRETSVHEHSSRSHTIFRVCVESYSHDKENPNRTHCYSCLNLVDLAGSERLGDMDSKPESVGETGYINKSLFVLANVINKLAEGKKGHIPYRDSKLTRILSHALGGNSLTAIICTVSPAAMNFYQTLSTLRFATRAKTVRNRPEKNEIEGQDLMLSEASEMQEQILKLQAELLDAREALDETINAKKTCEVQLEQADRRIRDLEDENQEFRARFDSSKTETNMNETNFIDKLLKNIYAIVEEDSEQGIGDNLEWSHIVEKTTASYKVELIALQNKYRDLLREEAKKHFPQHSGKIFNYLTTLNARDVQPNTKFSNEAVNELLKNIASKKVFSTDIFQCEKILKQRKPIHEIAGDLKNGLESCLKKLSDDYDEARMKLEVAFRSKVNQLNEAERNPRARGNEKQPVSIIKITNDHQEKLALLSHQYEFVLKQLETKYIQAKTFLQGNENSYLDKEEEDQEEQKPSKVLKQVDENMARNSVGSNGSLLKQREANSKTAVEPFQKSKAPSKLKSNQIGCYAYLWGSGKDGRLGNGSEKPSKFPSKLDNLKFAALCCSYHHSAAITEEGQVYTWGKGARGQLGVGNRKSELTPINVHLLNSVRVVQVACGWQHTLALTEEGRVFSWGLGTDGQLGHGNGNDYTIPEKVKFFDKMFVKKISAGHSTSAAITDSGDLYMWGCNLDYRLMIANNQNQFLPSLTELYALKQELELEEGILDVSLGVCHSAVITKQGMLFTAGLGTEGQLGGWIDEDTENALIVSHDSNSGRELEDASMEESQRSNAERTEKYCYLFYVPEFGADNKAIQVACGDNFTLVLDDKNRLYSFGKGTYNRLGQVSNNEDPNIYEPTIIQSLKKDKVVQISAGCRHAACINDKGQVYAWGFNFYDQLGMGHSDKDYTKPTLISKLANTTVRQISCGYFHTGALTDN